MFAVYIHAQYFYPLTSNFQYGNQCIELYENDIFDYKLKQ